MEKAKAALIKENEAETKWVKSLELKVSYIFIRKKALEDHIGITNQLRKNINTWENLVNKVKKKMSSILTATCIYNPPPKKKKFDFKAFPVMSRSFKQAEMFLCVN